VVKQLAVDLLEEITEFRDLLVREQSAPQPLMNLRRNHVSLKRRRHGKTPWNQGKGTGDLTTSSYTNRVFPVDPFAWHSNPGAHSWKEWASIEWQFAEPVCFRTAIPRVQLF
jgi:hypothetical protein